jgi:hypothetical protein
MIPFTRLQDEKNSHPEIWKNKCAIIIIIIIIIIFNEVQFFSS